MRCPGRVGLNITFTVQLSPALYVCPVIQTSEACVVAGWKSRLCAPCVNTTNGVGASVPPNPNVNVTVTELLVLPIAVEGNTELLAVPFAAAGNGARISFTSLLPESATKTLPLESTATPVGVRNPLPSELTVELALTVPGAAPPVPATISSTALRYSSAT